MRFSGHVQVYIIHRPYKSIQEMDISSSNLHNGQNKVMISDYL